MRIAATAFSTSSGNDTIADFDQVFEHKIAFGIDNDRTRCDWNDDIMDEHGGIRGFNRL